MISNAARRCVIDLPASLKKWSRHHIPGTRGQFFIYLGKLVSISCLSAKLPPRVSLLSWEAACLRIYS